MDRDPYRFVDLHPDVLLGTASDRYAGWLGQIYPRDRYEHRILRRTKTVAGKSFTEELLPVDSVEEYFRHFRVLEIDYTFYRPLLGPGGKPTANYHVLRQYREHMGPEGKLLLKAPQMVTARKLRRGEGLEENPGYLDWRAFAEQFYLPAVDLLGSALVGILFEQEYHRKPERASPEAAAKEWDAFFGRIPKDDRYHLELRTESYWAEPVFQVLEKHGIGQVLSHWTWLPSLVRQWARSGERFFNGGGTGVIRLMTPSNMRYEEAYARAHPFDKVVEEMLQPRMVEETVELARRAVAEGVTMQIIVNNRSGGNAPEIARRIAQRFLREDGRQTRDGGDPSRPEASPGSMCHFRSGPSGVKPNGTEMGRRRSG